MLKKIGAVLLAVGLLLPYTPGNRIVTGLFQDIPTILFQGVPVLITIAYVLHNFVPPLAQFHQRQGQWLPGLFRGVLFVLAGAYLAMSLAKEHAGWPAHFHVIVALVVTGGLLYWGQGRGTKAERLPLLLLICAGVPTIAYFLDAVHAGELMYGGWVFTAGYFVAAAGEVQGLRAAPKIADGRWVRGPPPPPPPRPPPRPPGGRAASLCPRPRPPPPMGEAPGLTARRCPATGTRGSRSP